MDLLSITVSILIVAAPFYIFTLKRKYDALCFTVAYYMGIAFLYLIIFEILIGKFESIPETTSSWVIAWLTLALVWVELDKRPELIMLDPVPAVYDAENVGSPGFVRADQEPGKLMECSWRKIGEASFPASNLRFDKTFGFEVEISNLGSQEIALHDYTVAVDGKKSSPVHYPKTLQNERTEIIATGFLWIETSGFHCVRIEARAAMARVSMEMWLFISEDLKKIRYIRVYPLHRPFSRLIKYLLRDP